VLRSAFSEDESFIEIDLVNKLQSIVEKQRDQIRTLDTSLADIKSELDEVTSTCPPFKGRTAPKTVFKSQNKEMRERIDSMSRIFLTVFIKKTQV
jgi:hypothetical protein